MSYEYTLDPELAKKAGQGLRINETGLYTGTITHAFACKSSQGTKGVEIMFKSDDGRTADYLQIWTRKQDGTSLMGEQVLHAIMTVTEQRNLTLKGGSVTRAGEAKTVDLFPELCGKRIAFVLQKEPYEKADGSVGDSMLIFMPLEVDTKRTAKEKLEKAPKGEAWQQVVATLKDKPLRKRQGNARPGGQSQAPAATSGQQFDDSDIPF
jgi:hypothetical protein